MARDVAEGRSEMDNSLGAEQGTLDWCPEDTVRVRVLRLPLTEETSGSSASEPSFDPYSTGTHRAAGRPASRRTLDDMRRLSNAIKRNRAAANVSWSGAFAQAEIEAETSPSPERFAEPSSA